MISLKDKVAIVTGARRGMGRTHSLALAKAGAKVTVSDINIEECQQIVEEIKKQGGEAMAFKCDVTNKKEIEEMIEKTVAEFGKLDILVNNAGIAEFKPFLELTDNDWEKTININLRGYFWAAQAAAKEMMKNKWGRIINIASIAAGQVGVGFRDLAHYCASKGGIAAMSEAMALELAPYNITVNCIAPGVIDTPMTNVFKEDPKTLEETLARIPLKRMGKPEEISNAVVFLASEESSYMTGSLIMVDGGWTAC